MSLHAFVDESRRNNTYLLAVALVPPGQLTKLRKLLNGLRMPNQRELHFKKETPARRKQILSALASAVVHVDIYLACCRKGEERARQTCVARLTTDVQKIGVTRLVFDSREVRDDHDLLTIRTALGKSAWGTGLFYEHVPSEHDPLLWIADIVAWCYGAGGDWLRRVQPLQGSVIDTRLPQKARSTAADRPDGHRAHFPGLRAGTDTRLPNSVMRTSRFTRWCSPCRCAAEHVSS